MIGAEGIRWPGAFTARDRLREKLLRQRRRRQRGSSPLGPRMNPTKVIGSPYERKVYVGEPMEVDDTDESEPMEWEPSYGAMSSGPVGTLQVATPLVLSTSQPPPQPRFPVRGHSMPPAPPPESARPATLPLTKANVARLPGATRPQDEDTKTNTDSLDSTMTFTPERVRAEREKRRARRRAKRGLRV